MNNIDKLGNLSIEDLRKLFKEIFSKIGYKDLKDFENKFLIGTTKSGLSTIKTAFYFYTKRLSGNDVDIEEICKDVNRILKNEQPEILLIISSQTISSSIESKIQEKIKLKVEFKSRDEVIELIEKYYPNFWLHNTLDLTSYEKYFLEEMSEKSALLNIHGLEERSKKLINIYIKPRIYEVTDDHESNKSRFNKVKEEDILKTNESCILEGDTGSGKSTLLKELGRLEIKNQQDLKILPVFITSTHLYNHKCKVVDAIKSLLLKKIDQDWEYVISNFGLLILIDNIDDFNKTEQKTIIKELELLNKKSNFRYVISTRSVENNNLTDNIENVRLFQINKFNDKQVREFVKRFFDSSNISANFLEALEDYRILERLPMTPLSLSLIALVFEKENHEIPATISDIYDNFNLLILGKITATKRFDMINFNFRERILSVYALEILLNNKGRPLSKEEFENFFKNYFKDKSSTVDISVLEEFFDYLIRKSGILVLQEEKYVNFSHKSFLEYYASLEIFKHKREYQTTLEDNFLNLNWQNVAVFYAGQSKDMPKFLRTIIKKVHLSENLEEHSNSIMGLGYLLQALYQTDNKLRKKAVLEALEQSLKLHDWYKKLSTEDSLLMFKDMRLPMISAFNMYFFYLNFLSSTLKEPLELAFNDLFTEYETNNETSIGYKLLIIASIFHSQRIKDSSFLLRLIEKTNLLKDPYLTTIADFSLYFDSSSSHREIKKQINKSFMKMNEVTSKLISEPARKLRFTQLDLIQSDKQVQILTEGITDSEIIEHAYTTLTDGMLPYWSISPCGTNNEGGAKELNTVLRKTKILNNHTVIGIFDNDKAGIDQFNGLQPLFKKYKGYNRVVKKSDASVYALKLPVPNFRDEYVNQEPENFYLAIEHYFENDLLEKNSMIKEINIPNIFKIQSSRSKKQKFSKEIRKIKDKNVFKHFIELFETIDDITGKKIDYYKHLD
ncbi:MAG: NACHT domain-containing protein [Bacteroidota bacterium]